MDNFHAKEKVAPQNERQKFKEISSSHLLNGVGFRVWDVEANDIQYLYEESHTLSLYIKGGNHTFRKDQPSLKGSEGKICLMPQGHLSRWHSPRPIRIAHLYIPDDVIRQGAEKHLDIDSRMANLRDLTYQSDEVLRMAMMSFIMCNKYCQFVDPMFAEERLITIITTLLERYSEQIQVSRKLPKGLSSEQRKVLKSYIYDKLSDKITLDDLATSLNMSTYHFARIFKLSFGDSPANYIIRTRIDKAKDLLKSKKGLTEIAFECGFSHHSHFNNYFKKLIGITPAKYRSISQSIVRY